MDVRDLKALSDAELVDVLTSLGDQRDLEDEEACRLGRSAMIRSPAPLKPEAPKPESGTSEPRTSEPGSLVRQRHGGLRLVA